MIILLILSPSMVCIYAQTNLIGACLPSGRLEGGVKPQAECNKGIENVKLKWLPGIFA